MHISRDVKQLEDVLRSYLENPKKNPLHYSELSKIFKRLRRLDRESYLEHIEKLPAEPLGDILLNSGGLPVHVAGTLRRDTWGGRDKLELLIDDVADPRQQA